MDLNLFIDFNIVVNAESGWEKINAGTGGEGIDFFSGGSSGSDGVL